MFPREVVAMIWQIMRMQHMPSQVSQPMLFVLSSRSASIGNFTKVFIVVFWNWRCNETLTDRDSALQKIKHLKLEGLEQYYLYND